MALAVPSRRLAVLAALATAVAACSLGDTGTGIEESQIANPRTASFSPAFTPPINVATMSVRDSGLFFTDFVVGTGDSVVASDTNQLAQTQIQVRYRGWLTNGAQFDSVVAPSPPAPFRMRQADLIRGWRAGLIGMRVGGQRRLVMSPLWAYGFNRNGPIPPNSILVFEVSLVGITRL